MTFSIMTLSILCYYVECRDYLNVMQSVVMLSVIMLSVVMLSVVMLSVVILSVVMLSVVAPPGGWFIIMSKSH